MVGWEGRDNVGEWEEWEERDWEDWEDDIIQVTVDEEERFNVFRVLKVLCNEGE